MKEYTVYEAEDGTTFEKRAEALDYEASEKIKTFLKELIDFQSGETLSSEEFCLFFDENRKEIYQQIERIMAERCGDDL